MDKESRIDDVPAVLMASLDFEIDPEHNFWFRAPWQSGYVYLQMNRHFPDGAMYSLWLGDGEFGDLEKLPPNWRRTAEFPWREGVSDDDGVTVPWDRWDTSDTGQSQPSFAERVRSWLRRRS